MAPRTLEPVAVPQLTIWGLRGLTALDPELTSESRDGKLRLMARDRVIALLPHHRTPISAAGRPSRRSLH